jgi:hypothetical protein
MKIRLAICLVLFNHFAIAGTPGISDMTLIYGGIVLILVGILGGNYLVRKFKKWREKKAELDGAEKMEDSDG